MKFVDEAIIEVSAGKGGDGALSFLRERHRPKGGPDGGNGGDGGSVYLCADAALNTLADFRHIRIYRARGGQRGGARDKFGACADDLSVRTPPGTQVSDADSGEVIGEVLRPGERLLVARGGRGGLGNARFKSSINRAPRRTTAGRGGDRRRLKLELKLLADAGLLGRPNAGKSTLLNCISHARAKTADYPFTTLHPQLGVIERDAGRFVVADIPGLIGGAAQGAGLGAQFLRHLTRTRLLLHLIDVAPDAAGEDTVDATTNVVDADNDSRIDSITAAIVDAINETENELHAHDSALAHKERWLVLNKIDRLTARQLDALRAQFSAHQRPVFFIAAIDARGCTQLIDALVQRLTQLTRDETDGDGNSHGRSDKHSNSDSHNVAHDNVNVADINIDNAATTKPAAQ